MRGDHVPPEARLRLQAHVPPPPFLLEPVYLGIEFRVKLLNKNFKEEIFNNHVQFERKIARATGKGVVSITVVPPRASLRNSWLISLKCSDTVLQLAKLYDELVSAGNTRPVTRLFCSGKLLLPDTRICEI